MGLGCFNGNRNSRMLLQDLHSTCTPSTCDSSNVSIEFTLRGGKCRRTAAARAVTNVTDWGHLVQWRFFVNYGRGRDDPPHSRTLDLQTERYVQIHGHRDSNAPKTGKPKL